MVPGRPESFARPRWPAKADRRNQRENARSGHAAFPAASPRPLNRDDRLFWNALAERRGDSAFAGQQSARRSFETGIAFSVGARQKTRGRREEALTLSENCWRYLKLVTSSPTGEVV